VSPSVATTLILPNRLPVVIRVTANADVGAAEVHWLDEEDPYVNPMGAKGVGEPGIVGTAAAIANAA
jgi:CO/xanthine dehydrogenase Mo-binding subunit